MLDCRQAELKKGNPMEKSGPHSLSAALTPTEVRGKNFRKVFRGFDPDEVSAFLEDLAKSWDRLVRSERKLSQELNAAKEELEKWRNREIELNQLRERALKEAEEIRNQASKEAARMIQQVEDRAVGVRSETESWLERVITDLEETQRRKMSFLSAFRASLDSHYELLKNESDEPEPLPNRLLQFLKDKQLSEEGHEI